MRAACEERNLLPDRNPASTPNLRAAVDRAGVPGCQSSGPVEPRRRFQSERPIELWLETMLKDGPMAVTEILAAAAGVPYSMHGLQTAKQVIGAYSPRRGVWALPPEGP